MRIRTRDDVATANLLIPRNGLRERIADSSALPPARTIDLKRGARFYQRLQERFVELRRRLKTIGVDVRIHVLANVVGMTKDVEESALNRAKNFIKVRRGYVRITPRKHGSS